MAHRFGVRPGRHGRRLRWRAGCPVHSGLDVADRLRSDHDRDGGRDAAGRKDVEASGTNRALPVTKIVLEGLVVGLVTGLVGAGGGFLVVPALALLGGLPMPIAVGTSLVVIAMKSFAGLAGYLSSVQIDWALAGAVTAAALVGALVGATHVPGEPRRTSQGVRLVRAGHVVGHPGAGGAPGVGRRRGWRDDPRRCGDVRVQPVCALPAAAPHLAGRGSGRAILTQVYPPG